MNFRCLFVKIEKGMHYYMPDQNPNLVTMKKYFFYCSLLAIATLVISCKNETAPFVKTNGTQFVIGDKPYYFMGTNFWYGLNLGSKGAGGDSDRIIRELVRLKK